jgi:hypothetical protein
MESAVLKVIFAIFLGLMVAFFVGFGISAFFPDPVYPNAINDLYAQAGDKAITPELQAQITELENAYANDQQVHNRIVSIIVTIAAVLFLGLSLVFEKRSLVLANGIMLGGLFALVYGAARGLGSQDSIVTFITVGVGLAAVVFIGLRRFSRPSEATSAPRD